MGLPWGFHCFNGGLRFPLSPHIVPINTKARSRSQNYSNSKPTRFEFPIKAACTAGALALTGDTAAQLHSKWVHKQSESEEKRKVAGKHLGEIHDWRRALRISSYGVFVYGPASHVWYTFLDTMLKEKTILNLALKVALNQAILGPSMIVLVFAWNSLWQGELDQLPRMYSNHALQTMIDGCKIWIPAAILNFGVVPLQARVAFMSTCSVAWNFYLSSTMGKS